MPSLTDYLTWRGDVTLAERPFNDVDNVILATLSYVDFTGVVPEKNASQSTVSVREACESLLAVTGDDVSPCIRSLAKVDAPFLRALAASSRFGEARLGGYVDVRDVDRMTQFSAVQVGLANGTTYVSFRGTDQTLLGWREDFMLSFEVTGAQRAAAAYLDEVAREGGRYMVGGHSKGGNLAVYAAIACSDETRSRIERVYCDDGPFMAPEVIPMGGYDVLGDRLRRIVPEYSVVGMLFDRPEAPRTIVRSSASGIPAHDPLTWQVGPSALVETNTLVPECVVADRAIASWLDGVGLDDRKAFTNAIFDALAAGGATTLDEIASGGIAGIQKVATAMAASDDRSREVFLKLLRAAVSSTATAAREGAASAVAGVFPPAPAPSPRMMRE